MATHLKPIEGFHHHEVCEIPLETGTPDNLIATHHFFSHLADRLGVTQTRKRLLLDVSKCKTVDPGGVLLLKYAGGRFHRLGWDAFLRGEGEVLEVVVANLQHHLLPKSKRHEPRQPGDYLMRGVESRRDMVNELVAWSESVGKGAPSVLPEQVALWQMQVAEVTTNAFQHPPSLGPQQNPIEIMIAGRAFREGVVQLAALDTGPGIARVIARVSNLDSDGDLISHACERGVSSRSVPENQGAGLYTLVETVKSNRNGRLIILANRGLVHVSKRRKYRRNLDDDFQGTFTTIILSTR